jgi:hypothetical protein
MEGAGLTSVELDELAIDITLGEEGSRSSWYEEEMPTVFLRRVSAVERVT